MTRGRPNGRPRGFVREALATWALEWAESGRPDGLPLADIVACVPGFDPHAPAELRRVRQAVMHMVQAGELVKVGELPRLGRYGRPAGLYAPPARPVGVGAASAVGVLSGAFTRWGLESTFCKVNDEP